GLSATTPLSAIGAVSVPLARFRDISQLATTTPATTISDNSPAALMIASRRPPAACEPPASRIVYTPGFACAIISADGYLSCVPGRLAGDRRGAGVGHVGGHHCGRGSTAATRASVRTESATRSVQARRRTRGRRPRRDGPAHERSGLQLRRAR